MNESISRVKELARASLRMRAMFLFTLSMMIMVLAISFMVVLSACRRVEMDSRSQFQDITFDLLEQHDFLVDVIKPGSSFKMDLGHLDPNFQKLTNVANHQGVGYWVGQGRRIGLPYVLAVPDKYADASAPPLQQMARLATSFARYFAKARGGRDYSAQYVSQAFMLDLNGGSSMTTPCPSAAIAQSVDVNPLLSTGCQIPIDMIRDNLRMVQRERGGDSPIQWYGLGFPGGAEGNVPGVVLYRDIDVDDTLWLGQSTRRLVIGTYLADHSLAEEGLGQSHAVLKSLRRVPHSDISSGYRAGAQEQLVIQSKRHLRMWGLDVDVVSNSGWVGRYSFPWTGFLESARWQVILFPPLLIVCVAGSAILYTRHRRLVVLPAKSSHDLIVESEAFSRSVIDVSKVAVAAMDIESGEIVVINRLARQWIGGTDDVRDVIKIYSSRVSGVKGELISESEPLTIEGRHLSVSYGYTTFRGADVILVALSDVTAHLKINSALAAAKEAADEANAGKTVFLATMSHEIRTPLYGVLGTVELLGMTELSLQQRTYLQTIQSSSVGLLDIIGDILDVSKIESRQVSLNIVDFDPVKLVEEIARTYAARAEGKGLGFYSFMDVDVPRSVKGDVLRVKQILGNLVSNAIKFSELGWVRVSLGVCAVGDGVVLSWSVTDTGIGISDKQKNQLFQPFYQVNGVVQSTPGTGLGLYICRSLSDLMGGAINVDSSLGHGSTFTLHLPLELGDEPAETLRQIAVPLQLAGLKVLVRSSILEWSCNVGAWLERSGAEVLATRDSDEGDYAGAVLVELSPEHMPPIDWSGARVTCTLGGPEMPQRGISAIHVNVHSLDGIALAVAMTLPLHAAGDGTIDAAVLAGDGDGVDSRMSRGKDGSAGSRSDLGRGRLGLRVLVAEDNPVNRALLVKQLEELGCEVASRSNGKEVLERWADSHFDVLMTDMNMPQMDGYDLVRALRSEGVKIPIIGITASSWQSHRETGMEMGLDAWVTKPIDLATLHECLSNVCSDRIQSGRGALASLTDVHAGESFSTYLEAIFHASMNEDMSLAWDALRSGAADELISVLHRMQGALAVMKMEGLSESLELIEARLRRDGWNPTISMAVRTTLDEIASVIASRSL